MRIFQGSLTDTLRDLPKNVDRILYDCQRIFQELERSLRRILQSILLRFLAGARQNRSRAREHP